MRTLMLNGQKSCNELRGALTRLYDDCVPSGCGVVGSLSKSQSPSLVVKRLMAADGRIYVLLQVLDRLREVWVFCWEAAHGCPKSMQGVLMVEIGGIGGGRRIEM